MIGKAYEAEGPVDFWRKWNIPAHRVLGKLYDKLGGIKRPVYATMATFAINGLFHEIMFIGLEKITNQDIYGPGASTAFFILAGIPVAIDNCLIKRKAKKYVGQQLDDLVEKYSPDKPKEILSEFSSNLNEEVKEKLIPYFQAYQRKKGKIVTTLFSETKRGILQVARNRKKRKKKQLVPLPIKTVLTFGYLLGLILTCNYLSRNLF